MPSLIEIRRRIRSVKNTQQITKAMKMVSAAKLRRAQDRVIAARPYAQMLEHIVRDLACAAAGTDIVESHPLLACRPENKIQLVVVTADTGLAGGFNSNVIKLSQRFVAEHASAEVILELVGRKGRDFFRRRNAKVSGEHTTLFMRGSVEAAPARAIAKELVDRFTKAEVDAVYIAVNHFKSVLASTLVIQKILPVELPQGGEDVGNYIFEQPAGDLLAQALPRYVENQIFRAMLESAAAYNAARMTAMDAATRNAGEMIDKLTLNMNRVRQASITREIIEIVSGAAALG
ncbi:MAG TPA: ATP synthase F1 subunit gamma [Bryobacteraceae bacterium]|nr:ATP synthase F1 subunit gamma [Bryobacteraceae bacterium]